MESRQTIEETANTLYSSPYQYYDQIPQKVRRYCMVGSVVTWSAGPIDGILNLVEFEELQRLEYACFFIDHPIADNTKIISRCPIIVNSTVGNNVSFEVFNAHFFGRCGKNMRISVIDEIIPSARFPQSSYAWSNISFKHPPLGLSIIPPTGSMICSHYISDELEYSVESQNLKPFYKNFLKNQNKYDVDRLSESEKMIYDKIRQELKEEKSSLRSSSLSTADILRVMPTVIPAAPAIRDEKEREEVTTLPSSSLLSQQTENKNSPKQEVLSKEINSESSFTQPPGGIRLN